MNRLSILLSSLALVVALTAGGAYAASTTVLNGNTIKNHTIGLAKLTPKAVKQLQGQRGPRGLDGFDGVDGTDGVDGMATTATGATGATGPAGGFDPAKVTFISGATVTIPRWRLRHAGSAPARLPQRSSAAGSTPPQGSATCRRRPTTTWTWQVWIYDASQESSSGTGWAYAVCAAA